MKNKIKSLALASSIALLGAAGSANAHLVSFGWNDNGNGTITMYGEHWHGDQSSSYSDNSGVTIDGILFQWTGVLNNADRDDMLASGALDGFQYGWEGPWEYQDWFLTDPLVLGNGTHTFFTGYNCCVDTMNGGPVTFEVTGITSVPPGTGPGQVGGQVPEPVSLALIGAGLAGLGFARRRTTK